MAASDFIELNSGSGGEKLAVDTNATVSHQRVKVQFGEPGLPADVTETNRLPVATASAGTQRTTIFRYLDTVGDGTGTKNANVDGSSTPVVFKIKPAAGQIFRISSMITTIRDAGTFGAEGYGVLSELSNGVDVLTYDGAATVLDLTDGLSLTTNASWARACYDADVKTWGAGDQFLSARWTFAKSGQMIRLDGDAGEELRIVVNDNLTGLVEHYFFINGYIE